MEMLFGHLSTDKGRQRHHLQRLRGFRHEWVTSPEMPIPDTPIEIRAFAGIDVPLVSGVVAYTDDGSNPLEFPDSIKVIPLKKRSIEWNHATGSYSEIWSGRIPALPKGTLVQYIVGAVLSNGELVHSPYSNENPDSEPKVYGYYLGESRIPDWLQRAIIYQIVPDRFSAGSGKKFRQTNMLMEIVGGTIAGITEKLDYISSLGVNCIWMTPIFPSPTHHGYDSTDFENIEPRLGLLDDFSRFALGCRSRNIKILLDFPANHVSASHPFFVEAKRDAKSKYVSWFRFDEWPKSYACYYNLPDMPILNTDNPEVREYLIDKAIEWLDRGGDGFRLDHAHGLSHLFWSVFRSRIRAKYPDAVMIGEATQSPERIRTYAGRMDGCLDFKIAELIRTYFAMRKIMTSDFAQQMERHLTFMMMDMLGPSFLDNHDMNRFLWLTKGDTRKLKLAALYQFCLPMPPIIYYGTEIGLSQRTAVGRLEESRLPMNWDDSQDHSLMSFYKDLTFFRHSSSDNNFSTRRIIRTDDEKEILVMQVGDYILMTNNGRMKQSVDLRVGNFELEMIVRTDDEISIDGDDLVLPPFSGAVLSMLGASKSKFWSDMPGSA
jgi:Glycosidases